MCAGRRVEDSGLGDERVGWLSRTRTRQAGPGNTVHRILIGTNDVDHASIWMLQLAFLLLESQY
jgi:hypothetical protein